MFNYIVVGAGISGITIAEKISNELNEEVLIIEKRKHIGGNCFDFYNKYGILQHKYGPHIFHTDLTEIWNYLSQFTDWHFYQHKVLSYVDGNYIPLPITTETINKIYNTKLSNSQAKKFLEKKSIPIKHIKNSKDVILSKAGYKIYEKLFKNYTKKQWDMYPGELDKSVIARIPIRYNNDTRYFSDKYQGVPKNGFTNMFLNMLDNPKIHILLNTDYKDIIPHITYNKMIYTGPIDYYFNFKFGRLKYRSLDFSLETYETESYQSVAVINYPNDYDFTRITEFKRITGQRHNKTTIAREYPTWNGEPYYPVPEIEQQELYKKYEKEARKINDIYFVGRLANYRYYNMDIAIKKSLDLLKKLKL